MRVLLLGLDSAGKTTILYRLMGRDDATVPTIGFNVETVRLRNGMEFLVWDVSGQDRLRPFWRHYYRGTSGVVFVVDSADVERLPMARNELFGILAEEELANAVVLIFSNKTDLPNAVTPAQLSAALQLERLGPRPYHIQPSKASVGEGLADGLDWLAEAMRKAQKSLVDGGVGSAFGIQSAPHLHANGSGSGAANRIPPPSTQVRDETSRYNTQSTATAIADTPAPPMAADYISAPTANGVPTEPPIDTAKSPTAIQTVETLRPTATA